MSTIVNGRPWAEDRRQEMGGGRREAGGGRRETGGGWVPTLAYRNRG
jgi:hypothetical protein